MDSSTFLIYAVAALMGITIIYFLFRWIFDVEKRTDQNQSIINLLKLIARKQGATDEEIHSAISHG